MDTQGVVTLDEAARLLGVSKSTASRLYKSGLLVGYKLTPAKNSPLRIYTASIDKVRELRGERSE